MPTYTASLVARVPASTGPPSFVEVEGLDFNQLSYIDEINKPGGATVSVANGTLSPEAKSRLRQFDYQPCEVWVYQNTNLVWAGEVQTIGLDGASVNLGCVGLLGYVTRMGVLTDVTYTTLDRSTILKNLVDSWQNVQPYGNFGIDTSGVTATGATQTVTYLSKDLVNIGSKIAELSAAQDGFDYWVDAASRKLRCASPDRGVDRTATIHLDKRVIASPTVAMSIAPQDFATVLASTATGQSTDGTSTSFQALYNTVPIRQAYGASYMSTSFTDLQTQGDLNGRSSAFLAARDGMLFQPGLTIRPQGEIQVGSFGVGDKVFYGYDAGLGFQSGDFGIAKLTVTVDKNNTEAMGVEFS